MVETGEKIAEVPCSTPTFTVAWHPKEPILAFACDDKVPLLYLSYLPSLSSYFNCLLNSCWPTKTKLEQLIFYVKIF